MGWILTLLALILAIVVTIPIGALVYWLLGGYWENRKRMINEEKKRRELIKYYNSTRRSRY